MIVSTEVAFAKFIGKYGFIKSWGDTFNRSRSINGNTRFNGTGTKG